MKSIIYYIRQLHRHTGLQLYVNIIGMVVNSLLESAGLLLLLPMLGVAGLLSFDQSSLGRLAFLSVLGRLPQSSAILVLLLVYLAIVALQNALTQAISIRNVAIQQNFSRKLRYDTYRALLQVQWSFYLRKRTSELVHLLTTELARVMGGINLFLTFITSLLFTLVQIVAAFWISPGMTLLILCFGALLALLSRQYIRKSRELGSRTSRLAQEYLTGISDQLHGFKDIKSNTLERSWLQWLQSLTYGTMREQLDYVRLKMKSQFLYQMSSSLLIACFVFVSYHFFRTQSHGILIVILLFARLWPRFTGLQSNLEQMAAAIPAFLAIQKMNDECRAWSEQGILDADDRLQPLVVTEGIECRDVFFRYHSDQPYALKAVNLHIPANRMTAIVGPSGAGKSTLIDLVMGLIKAESGQLLVDGRPIRSDNLLAYRRSIGYVAQDPFLYHASIRDNLLMIDPDATEERLWEALRFASSDEFVRKLPQGLDTIIGERGVRLSGGERQRIVLARAIIRRPSILVLDEATSALDTENERKILESLERLKGAMTIIVVAHRLSTVRNADQIVVIDSGTVVERGTYEHLLADGNSLFKRLASNQQ